MDNTVNAHFDELAHINQQKLGSAFFVIGDRHLFEGKLVPFLSKNPNFIHSFLHSLSLLRILDIFNETDLSQKLTGYQDEVRYGELEVDGKVIIFLIFQMTVFERQRITDNNLDISGTKVMIRLCGNWLYYKTMSVGNYAYHTTGLILLAYGYITSKPISEKNCSQYLSFLGQGSHI